MIAVQIVGSPNRREPRIALSACSQPDHEARPPSPAGPIGLHKKGRQGAQRPELCNDTFSIAIRPGSAPTDGAPPDRLEVTTVTSAACSALPHPPPDGASHVSLDVERRDGRTGSVMLTGLEPGATGRPPDHASTAISRARSHDCLRMERAQGRCHRRRPRSHRSSRQPAATRPGVAVRSPSSGLGADPTRVAARTSDVVDTCGSGDGSSSGER